MANTDKQNFRCDKRSRWEPAMARLEALREAGYEMGSEDERGSRRFDMTRVLGDRVNWIRDAPEAEIVEALGLVRVHAEEPAA